jgi:hypothetical protein
MGGKLRHGPLGVALVLLGASACTSLPGWLAPRTAIGPVEYPDLADMPARPAPQTTPEQREQVARSLEADRALLAQAAEGLRREIETSFEVPQPPAGP